MFDNLDLTKLIFGRLTWDAIPFHEPILLATFIAVAIGGMAVLGALTYFKLWGYLWSEWFTSIDHKKIGIMYMILGLVMMLRGFADAIMMRIQQSLSFGDSTGFLPLRPSLHCTWRDHDFLRRYAVCHRLDEFRAAAANWRTRRGVSISE
jgi:cytochrome o ubiquinol oxidase subunit 1